MTKEKELYRRFGEQHNRYTYNNIYIGKKAEKFVLWWISKNWGIPLEGTNFTNYNNDHGPDICNKELGFWGEIKNLAGHYYLSAKDIEELVLSRIPSWAKIKVLFISFKKVLDRSARKILRDNNIYIVEWGEQLIDQSWSKASHIMFSSIYPLYMDIKQSVLRFINTLHSISYIKVNKFSLSDINNVNLGITNGIKCITNALKDKFKLFNIKHTTKYIKVPNYNNINKVKYNNWASALGSVINV